MITILLTVIGTIIILMVIFLMGVVVGVMIAPEEDLRAARQQRKAARPRYVRKEEG